MNTWPGMWKKALTQSGHEGMALRDYFAAKVMQGLIEHYGQSDGKEPLARQAYEMADAMMLERDK